MKIKDQGELYKKARCVRYHAYVNNEDLTASAVIYCRAVPKALIVKFLDEAKADRPVPKDYPDAQSFHEVEEVWFKKWFGVVA